MPELDYKQVLEQAFEQLRELTEQRDQVDLEIAKLQHFVRATANMLPDEERVFFQATVEEWARDQLGLTDAIRNVLRTGAKWLTATEVRDSLLSTGFDFRGYTSNPLASIHAVLKRLKPDEVETTTIEGVAAYRWKASASTRLRPRRRGRLASGGLPALNKK